ncbi:dynamin family protein [Dictyobacter formicarum]|uniref:Dynamin n=1 Tax=Dictyobacter formicarum TaxID=2778368 RepID=A0ABQ3V804_9CHLR|nr:dynamin family protein [Dictyobacter formicarum]GHO82250.1 dynamin [Dictyobacter formicarum]
MATYEHKKQSALQLIRTAISFAQQTKQKESVSLLEDAARRLDDGKFMVVVCGEFRRGKSSLLNALLDEMVDFFPVDLNVTTNLVTTITYGPKEKITAVIGEANSDKETTKSITRAEIRKYVTEKDNPRNKLEARLIDIETPNSLLKRGLTLVDTPGIGALYTQHSDITYSFIPNADAILFVSDTIKPLSEVDLEFIKERILPYTQDIIFVLTKKDFVKDYQVMLEENRQKLAFTLDRPIDQIMIIPVSSLAKRDYLKSRFPEDLAESNFPLLESALWQFVGANRGRIMLAKALTTLSRVVGDLRRPLQVEYGTCQEQNQQKLDEIGENLEEVRLYLQRLQEDRAEWQTQLHYGMESIQRDVQLQFDRGFASIRHNVDGYALNDQIIDNPALVLGPLQTDINDLLYGLDRTINQLASDLQARLEFMTGLSLNPFEPDALAQHSKALTISGMPPVPQNDSAVRDVINVARNTSFLTSAVKTVVGFLGKFLGMGSIGIGAGLVATGASLFINSSERKRRMREIGRQHLNKYLHEMLIDVQREHNHNLFKTLRGLEQAMRSDLLDKIKREKRSREQALKSFQEARNLTASQSAARIALLKGPLQQLDQLQRNIEMLAQSITSHDDDLPATQNGPANKPDPSEPGNKSSQNRWADSDE